MDLLTMPYTITSFFLAGGAVVCLLEARFYAMKIHKLNNLQKGVLAKGVLVKKLIFIVSAECSFQIYKLSIVSAVRST